MKRLTLAGPCSTTEAEGAGAEERRIVFNSEDSPRTQREGGAEKSASRDGDGPKAPVELSEWEVKGNARDLRRMVAEASKREVALDRLLVEVRRHALHSDRDVGA